MILKTIKVFGIWSLILIMLFLIVTLSFNAFTYLNFDPSYGFLRLKQQAVESGYYLPAYYSHIFIAALVLLIGFFQLNTKLSLRWKRLHRFFGKCYAYGIFFFAAPGGLVMSFFIGRGPWVLSSFLLQTVLWFWFTYVAISKIRKGDQAQHRRWMWRSYALTFAAVTLRLYAFATSYSFDISDPSSYGIIAWLSWGFNLMAIEIYFFLKGDRSIDGNFKGLKNSKAA